MKVNRLAAAVLLHALPIHPLLAKTAVPQEAPPAPRSSQELPTFGVGTSAVTLDIVVRDKKGHAVRDLKASDFEVVEDGVKQRAESFEIYGRPPADAVTAEAKEAKAPPAPAPAVATPAPPSAAPSTPAAPEPEVRPQVIAFVFDRLGTDARKIAHDAALTYLDKGHVEGDLVAVFTIDLALRNVQPFTSEAFLIRTALDKAASQGNTAFANNTQARRDLIDIVAASESATDSVGAGAGQGSSAAAIGGAAGAAAVNQAVASVQAGMLRNFEGLERDQQGYASTNGLLAVVSGLKSLPGRKTVIFFSEGLAIPANVQAQFRSVIDNANRSNVSVYAMDAAGLRTHSLNEETRKEMMQANARRQRQLESGRDDGTGGSMTRALERNEDLLRLNPESGLGQLANETGGFLIINTNDAAAAFRRVEEDMRFHYLVGYSPSNENYDGRWRAIAVKVSRPGLQVQHRKGYYAIRSVESAPLKSFEAPALVQLDKKPRPSQFPIQATALSFPTPKRPGLSPVLVRVPGTAVTYVLDSEDKSGKRMHRADFSVVARVRNEAGHEVDRLSQHYVLSAPEANLEAVRRGDILFYREADLNPGRYTVEAVAYDAVSQKASVGTTVVDVPRPEAGRPSLSSIVLVGRAEKVPPSEQQGDNPNPLFYGETILYPNMGEPFKKATSPALGFFFTIYGMTEGASRKATIEVFRGDQPAGQVTAELPAPDANGRIQYAGALPISSFPPGSYRLKVTAQTGSGFDTRQTAFTVAE